MTARRSVGLVSCAVLSLALSGCQLFGIGGAGGSATTVEEMKAKNQSASDDAIYAQYQAALEKNKAAPESVTAAVSLASHVRLLNDTGIATRKKLDVGLLVLNAETALDKATAETSEDKTQVLMARANLHWVNGKRDEAIASLEAAFELTPKAGVAGALLEAYDKAAAPKEKMASVCEKARPNAADDEARYGLIHVCIQRLGRDGLPFENAKDDLAFYDGETARQQAEADAERRAEAERREREREEMNARAQQRASSQSSGGDSSSSGGTSQPKGPERYSVSLKNECSKTVKLFFGQKPKFGSGTYSSISSNTLTSRSGTVGDMIWIVDDGQNGLSSYSPRSGSQTVVITSGCGGFASR